MVGDRVLMEVRLKRDGMRKGDTGELQKRSSKVSKASLKGRGGREKRQRQPDNEKTRAGQCAHRTQAANVQDATRVEAEERAKDRGDKSEEDKRRRRETVNSKEELEEKKTILKGDCLRREIEIRRNARKKGKRRRQEGGGEGNQRAANA
ncbi:hypothetical protein WR25_11931 [Diploscapter pachys]|uniref:Uncharacterized protein n=1 Tax=Diploscapter pachys TaxID=2018661 RepID=A0A2A2LT89_9BILA|nr:hypothetical protein WR25_11931 [Diploscapter pachys]